jgi:hypothetical protein
LGVLVRSILLAFALVLVLPASALAAGDLNVTISGAGRVAGSGIDCTRAPVVNTTGTCALDGVPGPATLTAAPAPGFEFVNWSNDCAGTALTCTLDMAGNRAAAATFRDVEDPVVTLAAPLAGAAVKGLTKVSANVVDNGVIEKVQFKFGGWPSWPDDDAPYEADVPTVPLPDGPTQVTATAFDKAGNSHTAKVEIVVDNTLPLVGARGPDREAFAPGSTLTWETQMQDSGSGIAISACSVVPQGALREPVPCSSPGSHTVSGLPIGRYEFVFAAKDAAGNYAETVRLFRIEAPVAEGESTDGDLGAFAAPADGTPEAASAAAAPAGTVLAAPAPPKIGVALGFRYASLSRATKLSNFVVRGVPAGATVTVSCLKGCGKKSLKRFVKRAGRISLKALALRPLKVDTTITVVVSKPGHTSAVKVLEIRARKAPLVTTQCQPEGAPRPVDC